MNKSTHTLSLLSFFLTCSCLYAQKVYNLEQAINEALKNNKLINCAQLTIDQQKQNKYANLETPKTLITTGYGQINSVVKNDNSFLFSQSLPFPTVYSSNLKLGNALINESKVKKQITENELRFNVKTQYYQLLLLYQLKNVYTKQDSIALSFLNYANLRKKEGEGTALEQTNAETRKFNIANKLIQNKLDIEINLYKLQMLLGSSEPVQIDTKEIIELVWDQINDSIAFNQNPMIDYYQVQVDILNREKKVELAKSLPEFTLSYFNQSMIGIQTLNGNEVYFGPRDRLQGVQVGVSIPVFYGNFHHKIESKEIEKKIAENNYEYEKLNFDIQYKQGIQALAKNRNNVDYYRNYALPNSEKILNNIILSFNKGEIDYAEYIINLTQAITIQENYYQAILDYNLSVIYLDYLSGNI
jgi:cobalt-zinc-cadmium resistance protein CzcA